MAFFMRLERTVLTLGVCVLACAYYFFLRYWNLHYDSDIAMIGLLGRRAAEGLGLSLFVPSVGYQGLLLETGLMAFFFKAFGVGPSVQQFGPALLFGVFLILYYRVVRVSFGARVAAFTLFFLALSPPKLYVLVLRTLPNYAQTFFLGGLIWLVYLDAVRRWYVERKPLRGLRISVYAGVFGILIGFGFYTYAQIIYFVGAVGLHLGLLCFRRYGDGGEEKKNGSFELLKKDWIPLKTWAPILVIFTGALVLGYFPKIYYNHILDLPTLSPGQIDGDAVAIYKRARLLIQGYLNDFGALGGGWKSRMIQLVLGFSAVFYLITLRDGLRRMWKGSRAEALRLSPSLLLPLILIPTFVSVRAVVDLESSRYAAALFLTQALVFALLVERSLKSRSSLFKLFSSVGMAMVLVWNAALLVRKIDTRDTPYPLLETVSILSERGIRYGYGDYWHSYAITFLSNTNIRMEPVHSGYLPHFRDEVRKAAVVALTENRNLPTQVVDGFAEIHGIRYKLLETLDAGSIRIVLLERQR